MELLPEARSSVTSCLCSNLSDVFLLLLNSDVYAAFRSAHITRQILIKLKLNSGTQQRYLVLKGWPISKKNPQGCVLFKVNKTGWWNMCDLFSLFTESFSKWCNDNQKCCISLRLSLVYIPFYDIMHDIIRMERILKTISCIILV